MFVPNSNHWNFLLDSSLNFLYISCVFQIHGHSTVKCSVKSSPQQLANLAHDDETRRWIPHAGTWLVCSLLVSSIRYSLSILHTSWHFCVDLCWWEMKPDESDCVWICTRQRLTERNSVCVQKENHILNVFYLQLSEFTLKLIPFSHLICPSCDIWSFLISVNGRNVRRLVIYCCKSVQLVCRSI